MFCDLVGSTELSQKLDPEALRELMRSYQETSGAVIEKYDGHVAQYLGDGLMTYLHRPGRGWRDRRRRRLGAKARCRRDTQRRGPHPGTSWS